jgi:uncharacterized protein (DUF2235 family)
MKRLVLCCDGTWNRADQQSNDVPCPTNVIRIAYRVANRDGTGVPQITYYHQGVGTGNVVDRYSGGAFGEGLEQNIFDAYRFLIANYEVGDQIFLFGFSRGAFTARSIGGMIRNCGILTRASIRLYRKALELYQSGDHPPDDEVSKDFRQAHSITGVDSIPIHFIGVWDTVGALGIPLRGLRGLTRGKHQFHDIELSGTVRFAYHALAIDEHRAPFEPTPWFFKPKEGQTIEQVWFCGVHSDVGGGYAEAALSDLALDWMLGKAREAGLALDQAALDGNPLKGDPRGTLHDSKGGLYRITPGIDRRIGVSPKDPAKPDWSNVMDDPTHSLHPSVRARWDSDPKYRPASLKAYFKRIGDPRATA